MAPDDIGLDEYAEAWIDMVPHVPTLKGLAAKAKVVVEFGLRGAVSTWAMLEGLPQDGQLIGVDIDPNAPIPKAVREDPRFTFLVGDSLEVGLPAHADLVMVDSSHEFTQTVRELHRASLLTPDVIAVHDYLYPETPQVAAAVDGFTMPGYLEPPTYKLQYVEPSRWGLAVLTRK